MRRARLVSHAYLYTTSLKFKEWRKLAAASTVSVVSAIREKFSKVYEAAMSIREAFQVDTTYCTLLTHVTSGCSRSEGFQYSISWMICLFFYALVIYLIWNLNCLYHVLANMSTRRAWWGWCWPSSVRETKMDASEGCQRFDYVERHVVLVYPIMRKNDSESSRSSS